MENEKIILERLKDISEQMETMIINQSNIVNEVSRELQSFQVEFPDDYLTLEKLHYEMESLRCKLNKDNLSEEKLRKKIVLNLNLTAKAFAVILAIIATILGGLSIYYANTPAVLAQRMYEIRAQEDYANPGWFYHEMYNRILAGERKTVKSEIKLAEMNLQVRQKAAAILEPLLDNRPIFVHHVERDPDQPEALVTFRYRDNDVIWKAYFLPDGAVYVTSSENVKSIYDARKYLTSKRVRWEKVR